MVWALGLCPAAPAADTVAADEQTLKAADVPTTDQGLLEFFRRRTLAEPDRDRMKTLVAQLGDDSFAVREKASAALVALGNVAEPLLRQALNSTDIEVVRRAEDCLRMIKSGFSLAVPMAAARMVARRKPAGACEVLLAYLPFADNDLVAEEVRNALSAVAVRDRKPEAALVGALSDKDPVRRAAAAEALCRADLPAERSALTKLLKDPDPAVRLRVALAFAAAKDKEAVPVLIDVLGVLPPEQAWPAEDVLRRLAGDQAPDVALGTDSASRGRCRKAWADWWRDKGPKVDLARLSATPELLGYTLILLLDAGEALEVDAKGRTRWHIHGLQFPLDVQYIPGNRVLSAEYQGNRVTERNLKGEIVWEKHIENPLVAQRLSNGNTFIATQGQLLEVDHSGKEVFSLSPPNGEQIVKAEKLRNGDIACVYFGGRFVRMDGTGREIHSFPVDVRTSGGRLDVLPNGHVLVPEMATNKLREYDDQGKVVWEVEVQQPVAAVRLPNGNSLVTSLSQKRAVEIDRAGKVVWEYKSTDGGRVNRAFRR
jgi:hypothetical protein